jgi:hypothetical protein
MEIDGLLPDRCISCNEPAQGYPMERTLYWRPPWWRVVAWMALPALFLIGLVEPLVLGLFLPLLIVLAIADAFVRRKIVVECGLCRHHQNLRLGVRVGFFLSWVAMFALVAAFRTGLRAVEHWWFWAIVLLMFALAIAAGLLYRLRLARLKEERMWLKGTGRAFYEALPTASD